MSYSILDLAFLYIETFYPEDELTQQEKKSIVREISSILAKGFIDLDIRDAIQNTPLRSKLTPGEVLSGTFSGKPKVLNLLNPGEFYYHNQLRLMPGPPKVHLDINTGQMKRIQEDYFLEMKASYTIRQLTEYYLQQMDISPAHVDFNRYDGSFTWILKKLDIDTTLFMVDVATNYIQAEDLPIPITPAAILEYRTLAEETINLKITETRLAGDDKIAPKSRVLSSRRRSISKATGVQA